MNITINIIEIAVYIRKSFGNSFLKEGLSLSENLINKNEMKIQTIDITKQANSFEKNTIARSSFIDSINCSLLANERLATKYSITTPKKIQT